MGAGTGCGAAGGDGGGGVGGAVGGARGRPRRRLPASQRHSPARAMDNSSASAWAYRHIQGDLLEAGPLRRARVGARTHTHAHARTHT